MKIRVDKTKIATPFAMTALFASGAQVAEKVHTFAIPTDEVAHTSSQNIISNDAEFDEAIIEIKIPENPEQEGWTETHHKRFHSLAVKEAIGKLTEAEGVELERLTVLRRQEEGPRTGAEVIHEFRQLQVTRELVNALRKFVDFYEATGRSQRVS